MSLDNTDMTDVSRRGGWAAGPLLSVEGLSLREGGRALADGLSFTVAPGEMVGLVNADPARRDALMRIMTGRARPDHGRITLRGEPISGLKPPKILEAGLICATAPAIDPNETWLATVLRATAPAPTGLFGRLRGPPPKPAEAVCRATLAHCGFDPEGMAMPLDEPGLRRLSLAVALARSPKMIVLDGAERDGDGAGLARLLARAAADGLGVLLLAAGAGGPLPHLHRLVLMDGARKVADDTPIALADHPALADTPGR